MLYNMQMKNSTYCIKKDGKYVKEKLAKKQDILVFPLKSKSGSAAALKKPSPIPIKP